MMRPTQLDWFRYFRRTELSAYVGRTNVALCSRLKTCVIAYKVKQESYGLYESENALQLEFESERYCERMTKRPLQDTDARMTYAVRTRSTCTCPLRVHVLVKFRNPQHSGRNTAAVCSVLDPGPNIKFIFHFTKLRKILLFGLVLLMERTLSSCWCMLFSNIFTYISTINISIRCLASASQSISLLPLLVLCTWCYIR